MKKSAQKKQKKMSKCRSHRLLHFVFITSNIASSSHNDLLSPMMSQALSPWLQWWQERSHENYYSLKVNIKFTQIILVNHNPCHLGIFKPRYSFQTLVKCHLTPLKMSAIKEKREKNENDKYWQGCREIRILVHCW